MVRLSNEGTVKILGSLIYRIFKIQSYMTEMVPINAPKENCIYAIWHAHQLSVHSMKNYNNGKLNVMISHSRDGKIVAKITEKWGIKVIRASFCRKGCISGSQIKASDLYELGLMGGENSAALRNRVSTALHLGPTNAKTLLKRANALGLTRAQLEDAIHE